MVNLDILADTVFRDEAAKAVDAFVHEHDCPVKRAQIAGLRQIAANEPARLLEFGKHQREKAARRLEATRRDDKRAEFEGQIAFWDLVSRLCGASGGGETSWSLSKLAEEQAPADCRGVHRPPGNAPAEEHRAYREAKARADAWQAQRKAEDYPVFYQRFCAHYLYRLSQYHQPDEGRGER